ncbi:RNA/RNP complex-1-interacting phosphatase isoform X1 [Tachyglossus aculeatus]|uniref:RNA/RNP complex-1-interacting phosphatase isoform X1 n=1 Tax=Tachyglossus aculeatus TaxID=9261 RepID=UPI0018F465A2|nr:RNA/RNP complex-1-interacting phosphatase isoform X1 [Tachyglossus aculeatus]
MSAGSRCRRRKTPNMATATAPEQEKEQEKEEEKGGRRRPGKGGSRLPDRWKDYLPLGRRMPGTRFIAFKVPLEKSFNGKLAPGERFSPSDLISRIRAQKEELGLIIDLTYTQRYYKPKELPDTLLYRKIFTVGHHVPDDGTIFKFKCAVNQFLGENKDNDKLIGVHCTHGLNRTGYLVCRYLIDVEGMEPNSAIELFNSCRGHSIERKNYIRDLQDGPIRNNDGPEASGPDRFRESQQPKRPVWNANYQGPSHNSPAPWGLPAEERDFHTPPWGSPAQKRDFHSGPWGFPAEPQDFPAPPRDFYHQSWDLHSHPWNLSCQPPGFHPTTRTAQRNLKSLGPNTKASRHPPPGPPGDNFGQARYTWTPRPGPREPNGPPNGQTRPRKRPWRTVTGGTRSRGGRGPQPPPRHVVVPERAIKSHF